MPCCRSTPIPHVPLLLSTLPPHSAATTCVCCRPCLCADSSASASAPLVQDDSSPIPTAIGASMDPACVSASSVASSSSPVQVPCGKKEQELMSKLQAGEGLNFEDFQNLTERCLLCGHVFLTSMFKSHRDWAH
ncbi:hypothetical protein H2248_001788 [Termitomyces sp. 'cryptogamus']|nr:hypothetical protein H2248_001788 [Termitomyces sp. 'cryptogamus']